MRIFSSVLLLGFIFLVPSYVAAQQPTLLLTGKLGSAQKQIVTSPRSSRWNIQIQWLEEEGKVVEKGDLVAVFDGSLMQSQLEVNQERLETEKLELTQKKMELEQKFLEAQGDVEVATMRVAQAEIEAGVPDGQVSDFDKGKYKLTLQRSKMESVKAQEKLTLAKEALQTGVQKQLIEIARIEEDIRFQKNRLSKMSIEAQFKGPINYAMHPWTGEKMAAGINVQAAWNILDVQAIENFQIESWVHEIDVDKIEQQQTVELVLDAYPSKRFKGKLLFVSTQAEKKSQWSNSVYYPVIYQFENEPQLKLLPGMSVRVTVPQGPTTASVKSTQDGE